MSIPEKERQWRLFNALTDTMMHTWNVQPPALLLR